MALLYTRNVHITVRVISSGNVRDLITVRRVASKTFASARKQFAAAGAFQTFRDHPGIKGNYTCVVPSGSTRSQLIRTSISVMMMMKRGGGQQV